MNYRNNFVQIALILGFLLVSSIGADDVELILDSQRDEIVARYDNVLMLFREFPTKLLKLHPQLVQTEATRAWVWI